MISGALDEGEGRGRFYGGIESKKEFDSDD